MDGDPTAIAVGAGFVWVACTGTRTVDRIDPRLNKRTQGIPVGNGPSGIAISPGAVWVTNRLDDTVTKIDSKSGKILRAHLNAGQSPSDIAYGLGALWITNESTATVTRLDPRTGGLQPIHVGNGPEAVAIGTGSVWVANSLDGTVWRIDPGDNAVSSVISVGAGPSSVLATEGSIWVADSYGGRIVRIDPATNHIVNTINVTNGPQSLATIGGRIWLSARQTAAARGGGSLHLFDTLVPDSLDEGVGYASTAWSVFPVTGDGLVGFKRVGGLDGGTLVPDLATSLPEPTDGGLTYTFQLRRGIRYSNGDPYVRATCDARSSVTSDSTAGTATFFGDLVAGEVIGADVLLEVALRPLPRRRHGRSRRHGGPTPRQAGPRALLQARPALRLPGAAHGLDDEALPARGSWNRALHDSKLRPPDASCSCVTAIQGMVPRRAAQRVSRPDRRDLCP